MIRIEIRGAAAVCTRPQLLTAGMVGAEMEFMFDDLWQGLSKCAVFTDGMDSRDAVLVNDRCVIPHELLTTAGRVLCVGVYGVNEAGDVVIPTIYAQVGMVRPGADPTGDESYPPTPDVGQQALAAANAAREKAEEILRRAEDGDFDGAGGDVGSPGKDGISATHTWNGTVLTISSASGTSSADLKGDKGDPGEQGERGEKGDTGAAGKDGETGADGKTPVRGVDYWTAEDKQEVINEVLAALPNAEGGSF